MDTKIISTITPHGPGYLNKDLEQIVGFRLTSPLSVLYSPSVEFEWHKTCSENGYEVDHL